MAQTYSFPGPTGLTTTTDGRKDIAGLIARDINGAPRPGVFPRHLNALVTSTATMSVNVAAFEACAVQYGGAILLTNDGTVAVAIATAPVSNSRIDVVYIKQNESAAPGTDADNSKQLAVATGIPAASPVAPSIPTGAISLAQVLVPSGALATNAGGVTITPTHLYTATAGGTVVCRNQTELTAWNAADGNQAYSIADQLVYNRVGGAWLQNGPIGNALAIRIFGYAYALAGSYVLPTAFAAIPNATLSLPVVAGQKYIIKATANIYNAASGNPRTVTLRLMEGGTAIGTQLTFGSVFIASSTANSDVIYASRTAAATGTLVYTVQGLCNAASSCSVFDVEIQAILTP